MFKKQKDMKMQLINEECFIDAEKVISTGFTVGYIPRNHSCFQGQVLVFILIILIGEMINKRKREVYEPKYYYSNRAHVLKYKRPWNPALLLKTGALEQAQHQNKPRLPKRVFHELEQLINFLVPGRNGEDQRAQNQQQCFEDPVQRKLGEVHEHQN
ncbi:Hypothetical_protein [Hexamita inflata]|uniref:Hypothetical_protein n=1 Tax=Hexamita inflata TaxID=28002 RepID=A0ABP1LT79_9EUKA